MKEAKNLSEIFPSFEADLQTNAGNIFTPMITNDNVRKRTSELKEENRKANATQGLSVTSPMVESLNPKTYQMNKSKRKISVNAGKGAINYMQLPN